MGRNSRNQPWPLLVCLLAAQSSVLTLASSVLKPGGVHDTTVVQQPPPAASNNSTTSSTNANIVGGVVVAEPEKYPYFAIPATGTLCGATLVHEDILITAAHCEGVFSNKDIFIGATFVDGKDAKEKARTSIERVHPNYDDLTLSNDLMLVKLTSASNVTPAGYAIYSSVPEVGKPATVIGFGATKFKGEISTRLQSASVEVRPNSDCEAGYGKLNSTIHICAGRAGRDSCNGDSGGPLLVGNTVVGVVSFGYQCGQEGYPGVYSRIGAMDSFIADGICTMSDNPPDSCPDTCKKNTCRSLFASKGSTMFRMDGTCVETCAASLFTSVLRISGWRCGKCP